MTGANAAPVELAENRNGLSAEQFLFWLPFQEVNAM
jgi:hypothetical protein